MLDPEPKSPCLHPHPGCRGGCWRMPRHVLLQECSLTPCPCICQHVFIPAFLQREGSKQRHEVHFWMNCLRMSP